MRGYLQKLINLPELYRLRAVRMLLTDLGKTFSKINSLTCATALILLNLAYFPQVQAQVSIGATKPPANTQNSLSELKFPNNGAPIGRRKGGGSRDSCPDLKTPITALVPGEETANESKSFTALTVSDYPTFWVYLPELPATLRFGEFVFQGEQGNNIWRTAITLPGKPGVIGVTVPSNPQYALKTGNKYQWYLKVYCGATQNTSEYFYVKSWVQRVALTPSIENSLKRAKPKEYVAYATNNIWNDAVTNLAQLRRINPGARILSEDWTNLLKAVGLEEFAGAPIIERYSS